MKLSNLKFKYVTLSVCLLRVCLLSVCLLSVCLWTQLKAGLENAKKCLSADFVCPKVPARPDHLVSEAHHARMGRAQAKRVCLAGHDCQMSAADAASLHAKFKSKMQIEFLALYLGCKKKNLN